MATVTVRALDEDLKARLRARAAQHGRSMEAEIRAILADALTEPVPGRLGSRMRSRFASLDGVDLPVPERSEPARAATF